MAVRLLKSGTYRMCNRHGQRGPRESAWLLVTAVRRVRRERRPPA